MRLQTMIITRSEPNPEKTKLNPIQNLIKPEWGTYEYNTENQNQPN